MQQAAEKYATNVYEAAGFLQARGIGEQAALSFRLGVVSEPIPGHERFQGMLSVPYLTPAGVVAIKFRALDPERTPKYDALAGQHARLYNAAALHTDGDVIAVCEGELDALVMTTVVGIPAVGIPGASHWQEHWGRCFADFERVLVIADHDVREDGKTPGQNHAEKVAKKVGGRVVLPPPGMDLGEWHLTEGPGAIRERCGV